MYEYLERQISSKVFEFYCKVPSGHRVIKIDLERPTPVITAYNETSARRDPAQVWLTEIEDLVERAKTLTKEQQQNEIR